MMGTLGNKRMILGQHGGATGKAKLKDFYLKGTFTGRIKRHTDSLATGSFPQWALTAGAEPI